jgi:quercetin dioxygenase-like cupin family protein
MHRTLLTTALTIATVGATACSKSEPSAPSSQDRFDAPAGSSFSLASNYTNTRIARANAGPIRWRSSYQDFDVVLKSEQSTDLEVTTGLAHPGGHTGWHYHPGPVFVLVKTGTLTVYEADDDKCRGRTYAAGSAFIEGTTPHIVRNEGAVDAEIVGVFFVPVGQPRRIESNPPGTCPF